MSRVVISFAPLLLLPVHVPAQAQTAPAADSGSSTACKLSEPKKRGSAMLGGMLGRMANRALEQTGITRHLPTNTLATTLTDAVACKLDAQEQKQAASATLEAVRGGVGSSARWTSATRPGVSGSSMVTAQSQTAAGASCMDVNDVIIVDGEETTVSKRMCRAPGASGYTLAA